MSYLQDNQSLINIQLDIQFEVHLRNLVNKSTQGVLLPLDIWYLFRKDWDCIDHHAMVSEFDNNASMDVQLILQHRRILDGAFLLCIQHLFHKNPDKDFCNGNPCKHYLHYNHHQFGIHIQHSHQLM